MNVAELVEKLKGVETDVMVEQQGSCILWWSNVHW